MVGQSVHIEGEPKWSDRSSDETNIIPQSYDVGELRRESFAVPANLSLVSMAKALRRHGEIFPSGVYTN
jgi:hypothetical protein